LKEEAEDYKYYITSEHTYLFDSDIQYWITRKRRHEERSPELKSYGFFRGVSQGSPISPILSTLIITKDLLIKPDTKIVQYADDGILYDFTRTPFETLKFPPASGVEVN
jgi:hypothetical protein